MSRARSRVDNARRMHELKKSWRCGNSLASSQPSRRQLEQSSGRAQCPTRVPVFLRKRVSERTKMFWTRQPRALRRSARLALEFVTVNSSAQVQSLVEMGQATDEAVQLCLVNVVQ